MTLHQQIAAFLEQIGAGRLLPGDPPASEESLWRLGTTTVAVQVRPDGTMRVYEVVVSSQSLPHVLDAIGNLEAKRIAATREHSQQPNLADE